MTFLSVFVDGESLRPRRWAQTKNSPPRLLLQADGREDEGAADEVQRAEGRGGPGRGRPVGRTPEDLGAEDIARWKI